MATHDGMARRIETETDHENPLHDRLTHVGHARDLHRIVRALIDSNDDDGSAMATFRRLAYARLANISLWLDAHTPSDGTQ